MCWKSPPTLDPAATVTLPPSRIAETRRFRTFLFGSMTWWISSRRTKLPWEWPIRTTPRPRLYLRR